MEMPKLSGKRNRGYVGVETCISLFIFRKFK